MDDRPKRTIVKPRRFQTTSSDEADLGRNKAMELQDKQLEDDVAELRGVLEDHSPNLNTLHAHQSFTHTQPTTNHDHHIRHASDTTHSLTNVHSSIHTTQAFNITSHSSTYTQPLTVTHTTQAPFMHQKASSYTGQNFHSIHTTQSFTHEPHATYTQHIGGNRLNTPETQLPASNIWPTPSYLPSSTQGEFYNVRPEIQAIHGKLDQLALEVQKIHKTLNTLLTKMNNSQRHVPEKPAFLPISSVADIENFETANDEEYMKLVSKTKFYRVYTYIYIIYIRCYG
ncbi:PREDICTED: uncharacterized protein LOC105564342 [Vollenhovia emeryi]|uniref:uncharacterized protein LOC105564342 n=1 Tax=Vollenhovia emeryi TaxID=411798 RepID=UPI0005F52FBC|nr:PREDICTED: uncharacterized protein LOC105564342 [Vollenhovia emeryi]